MLLNWGCYGLVLFCFGVSLWSDTVTAVSTIHTWFMRSFCDSINLGCDHSPGCAWFWCGGFSAARFRMIHTFGVKIFPGVISAVMEGFPYPTFTFWVWNQSQVGWYWSFFKSASSTPGIRSYLRVWTILVRNPRRQWVRVCIRVCTIHTWVWNFPWRVWTGFFAAGLQHDSEWFTPGVWSFSQVWLFLQWRDFFIIAGTSSREIGCLKVILFSIF